MIEKILSNELYIILIAIGVMLVPFIICGHHYKKFGIIQGIFSVITVPMLFCALGDLLCFIFKDNANMSAFFKGAFVGLDAFFQVYRKLFSFTTWEWLYATGWIYMPAIVIFILSYGYSITIRNKRKKSKKEE